MSDKPWIYQIESAKFNDISVPIYSKDFKLLAEYLGASDEGLDLVKKAFQYLIDVSSDQVSASDLLLNKRLFSWEDLLDAISHGVKTIYDQGDGVEDIINSEILCVVENQYNESYGYHRVQYCYPTSCWIYLARVFYLSATYNTECDALIRWHLYHNDFIYYFCQITPSSREIIKILDARSLDFFLPRFLSPEWDSSLHLPNLFEQLNGIVRALKSLGRVEEAEALSRELVAKEAAYRGLAECGSSNNHGNDIRLTAERTWVNYLGVFVWESLLPESRSDFIDAFASERATESGYYRSWRYAIQSMTSVIEREINHSLVTLLKLSIYPEINFKPKNARSSSREKTYQAVLRAHRNDTFLTLGELTFVLKFWNDSHMDECTDLFVLARRRLNAITNSSQKIIKSLNELFSETLGEQTPPWNIVKLRNSCAHPGDEKPLRDREMFTQLKDLIGDPPRRVISAVVMGLRGLDYSLNSTCE